MFDKFSDEALKAAHDALSDQAHARPPLEVLMKAAIPLMRELIGKELEGRKPKGDPKSR